MTDRIRDYQASGVTDYSNPTLRLQFSGLVLAVMNKLCGFVT